jgi:hypothetical protein
MNRDFVDLLRALSAADARFLIVGAYALAVHGRPRATGDLDILIDATPANAPRVVDALTRFGAPLADVQESDFAKPGAASRSKRRGRIGSVGLSARSKPTSSARPRLSATSARRDGRRICWTSKAWADRSRTLNPEPSPEP